MSFSLLDLDARFRELEHIFQNGAPLAHKVLALAEFVACCGDDPTAVEAYLLETGTVLESLAEDIELIGTDPAPFICALEAIEHVAAKMPRGPIREMLFAVLTSVRRQTARLLAWGGLLDELLTLLRLPADLRNPKQDGHAPGEPETRIAWLAEKYASINTARHADLDWILAEWRPWTATHPRAAAVPVTSALPFLAGRTLEIGILCPMEVHVHGEIDQKEDRMWASHAVVRESGATDEAKTAAKAGRAVLNQLFRGQSGKKYAATAHMPRSVSAVRGSSANAAMAALFISGVLRKSLSRERFDLASDIAVSADCDEAGNILPINPDSLSLKVKAAVYSWTRRLAVPDCQKAEAEHWLRSHRERAPLGRPLTIVGISHVSDLFHDRRLTCSYRTNWMRHSARIAWSQKTATLSSAAAIILLVTLGLVLTSPLDRNPVSADWEGKYMLVKNRYGQVIERIEVGVETVLVVRERAVQSMSAAFLDVTNDGRNEIIWVEGGRPSNNFLPHIRAKRVGKIDTLWSINGRRKLEYPHSPDINTAEFTAFPLLQAIPNDTGMDPTIIAVFNHQFFPGILVSIDALTGTERQYYAHPGHIRAISLDGNRNETDPVIIAIGVNNAYREPFLAVLDVRFLSGHGPATRPYIPAFHEPAVEKLYIRLPYCESAARSPGYLFSQASGIRRTNNTWELKTTKIFRNPESNHPPLIDGLIHYLTEDFRYQGIGRTSQYDAHLDAMVQDYVIEALPPVEYYRDMPERARYWNGTEWVKEYTLNQRYVDRLAALGEEGAIAADSRDWN